MLDDICPKLDIRQDQPLLHDRPTQLETSRRKTKTNRADIAEVYLQINLEPQNYSLFKELLFSTRSAFYRFTSRSRTHTSAGEYAGIKTNRQRQTCPNSIDSDFKLLDSGRITAWLQPLRQGQVYCGRRELRVVGVIKPKSFESLRFRPYAYVSLLNRVRNLTPFFRPVKPCHFNFSFWVKSLT